jgi:GTP cyclohydrolase I
MEKTDNQTEKVSDIYSELLATIGEDPKREGLVKTPLRAAKALQFLTHGYDLDLAQVVGDAIFTSNNNEMILLKDIDLVSVCEHHLLPFVGKCHVAYLPNGKIIGLSKIPRVVEMFARRLQVQENLTVEIAESIMKMTGALGVGVVIEAQHMCMIARGVEKNKIKITTSSMLGAFLESAKTRQEFLSLLK